MPASAAADIPVSEAEMRLGIGSGAEKDKAGTSGSINTDSTPSFQEGMQESNTGSLPVSLLNRKVKPISVSRTFRLPLELANQLEQISTLHEIPMVTILAEALEIHLARFPRHKTG